jgi:hypothetical protein
MQNIPLPLWTRINSFFIDKIKIFALHGNILVNLGISNFNNS